MALLASLLRYVPVAVVIAVAKGYIAEIRVTRENTTWRQPPPEEVPDSAAVVVQLERILSTSLFQHSKRYPTFLRHVVEQTLCGACDGLKERTLGITVFRRSPEYDTSADPVVRNTASEVRKRLEEYYSDPSRERELRIALPAGAYVPEFRYPAAIASPDPEPAAIAVPAPWWHRRATWRAGAVALLAAVGLLAAIELPRRPAIKLFWAPILQGADPVLVVADTWVGIGDGHDNSSPASGQVREIMDPNVFLRVSEQSAKLATFLGSQGKRIDQELARNVGLANLRGRPFILRGAFNNQWTPRAVAPYRFHFQLDRNPLVRRIVDRQNPDRRDWAAPMTSGLTEDYALIARAPEPETGQMMVVIAGLGEKGSAAALEFVTNPKYLERFAAGAPSGWERRNIELVIKTNVLNEDWGDLALSPPISGNANHFLHYLLLAVSSKRFAHGARNGPPLRPPRPLEFICRG